MKRRPHAHPREDDMVGWLPEQAPPYSARQLILAFGAAIPIVLLVGCLIALAFIVLGASPEAHPGWW